jgi:predicted RNase H-like HicB family nuclease
VQVKRRFTATVWQEGSWFVAQCLEIDVASQGETEDEALSNLREAVELYFEPPRATDAPQIRTIEVELDAA